MPKHLSIADFTYELPSEKIAFHPLTERDQSKLLIYDGGKISENIYASIDQYLDKDSLLLFNNTKVVEARLLFTKDTGASIEIFCLEPGNEYPDISTAMQQKAAVNWNCLIGGASKWKAGQVLEKKIPTASGTLLLTATYMGKNNESFSVLLKWSDPSMSFAELLHLAGVIPLPPYIKRTASAADTERYQTIYARHDGSVAAPTAGLHFTAAVFEKLSRKNIQRSFVTLHVGAGTFKPVKASVMADHEMHAEFIEVSTEVIQTIADYLHQKITCVGTTSLRTIESLYWMGVKVSNDRGIVPGALKVQQWDPYETDDRITTEAALQSLLQWMRRHGLERIITTTQLLIAPGYRFRIVNNLVTNFHQPQSTLLLLVAAFVGDDWRKVYDYALENNFRFLSYGDGCLLKRR